MNRMSFHVFKEKPKPETVSLLEKNSLVIVGDLNKTVNLQVYRVERSTNQLTQNYIEITPDRFKQLTQNGRLSTLPWPIPKNNDDTNIHPGKVIQIPLVPGTTLYRDFVVKPKFGETLVGYDRMQTLKAELDKRVNSLSPSEQRDSSYYHARSYLNMYLRLTPDPKTDDDSWLLLENASPIFGRAPKIVREIADCMKFIGQEKELFTRTRPIESLQDSEEIKKNLLEKIAEAKNLNLSSKRQDGITVLERCLEQGRIPTRADFERISSDSGFRPQCLVEIDKLLPGKTQRHVMSWINEKTHTKEKSDGIELQPTAKSEVSHSKTPG